MHNSLALITFTVLCIYHLDPVQKHYHYPKENPVSFKLSFPILSSSQHQATANLFSVSEFI